MTYLDPEEFSMPSNRAGILQAGSWPCRSLSPALIELTQQRWEFSTGELYLCFPFSYRRATVPPSSLCLWCCLRPGLPADMNVDVFVCVRESESQLVRGRERESERERGKESVQYIGLVSCWGLITEFLPASYMVD